MSLGIIKGTSHPLIIYHYAGKYDKKLSTQRCMMYQVSGITYCEPPFLIRLSACE